MSWIESKKVRLIILCLTIAFCQGCSSDKKEKVKLPAKSAKQALTNKELIKEQVENDLDISAAEQYDIQIHSEFINADTLKDQLILINRKQFAYKHVKATGSKNFFDRMGHSAPYNYVFVKLGGSNEILSTTPVGSNVDYPLKSEFLFLTSKANKDFYVDYRIKNSLQRNYYAVRNNTIYLTFSCPIFDSIGSKNPVVYAIEHKNSPLRISKDIVMYKGQFSDYQPDKIENPNDFTPKNIKSKGEVFAYFIFDNDKMKYVTPMRPD